MLAITLDNNNHYINLFHKIQRHYFGENITVGLYTKKIADSTHEYILIHLVTPMDMDHYKRRKLCDNRL